MKSFKNIKNVHLCLVFMLLFGCASKKLQCAKTTFTVLEETVRAGSHDLDIIRHPMIQKLIEVKWRQFGRRGKSVCALGF